MKSIYTSIIVAFVVTFVGCQRQRPANPDRPSTVRNRETVFKENESGFVELPRINLENIDDHIAQINTRGLKRIELQRIDGDARHDAQQTELLKSILMSCPQLVALALTEWEFSATELRTILDNLSDLKQLQLVACRFTAGADNDNADVISHSKDSGINSLTVNGCFGIDNDLLLKILSATPNLEELTLAADSRIDGGFDCANWPFRKLSRLQRFVMYTDADDEFARTLLANVPGLVSLQLQHCAAVTGKGWLPLENTRIEELDIRGCPGVTDEHLEALLKQLPNLQSLNMRGCRGVTGASWELSAVPNLRKLSISGPQLSMGFLVRSLESLTLLEELRMYNLYPAYDGEFSFSGLNRLRHVDIDGCALPRNLAATLSPTIESLNLNHCVVNNSAVGKMLMRLTNLETLKLTWLHGGSGRHKNPEAVTGDGWSFEALTKLRHLDLTKCRNLTDDLIARIPEQLPNLESLKLGDSRILTGKGWNLHRLAKLSRLELSDFEVLQDSTMNELPSSLTWLRIRKCQRFSGRAWNLTQLKCLHELSIANCDSLTSLGTGLPTSLKNLRLYECQNVQCSDFDYSGAGQLETMAFSECHKLDVDRLFAELPQRASSLQRLCLTACPDPTTTGWDLSPLSDTLRVLNYQEGDSSLVGGVSESNYELLRKQLPQTKVSN